MTTGSTSKRAALALTVLWAFTVVTAFVSRPLLPNDETRYLSVAWEMWTRGDFLVPYMDGAPYSHKPPLLFWLMQLGWAAFGVNEWWPRLVPSLFALADLFLTARLARLLWPACANAAQVAPWILFGSLLWAVFTTVTLFDMLLTCAVLLGLIGVLLAVRGQTKRGWSLLGTAIGFGLLAKGPAVLLHVLPAALLAPWWTTAAAPVRWGRWYLGVAAATLGGAAIALAWALPAGLAGGPEYRDAIFWGQTAGRMAAAEAPHARAWWWYLPVLPLALLPWSFWPRVWRGLWRLRDVREVGVRFCLAWLVPALIGFSLVSGKQVHYLVPLIPACALLVAYGMSAEQGGTRWERLLPGLLFAAVGAILVAAPYAALRAPLPEWVASLSPFPGLVLLCAGIALALLPLSRRVSGVVAVSVAGVAMVAVLNLGPVSRIAPATDVRPISEYLGRLERAGHPIAYLGNYQGQYHFLGRLHAPIASLVVAQLPAWIASHPDGRIVSFSGQMSERALLLGQDHRGTGAHRLPRGVVPEYVQAYRGATLNVWSGAAVRSGFE